MYRPRPTSAKNLKPRPKSGARYARRYKYPTSKKSVFKNIRCYKYEPRPTTPKNYLPRPKSGPRYVYTGRTCGPNPYQKRSVFKPAQRYVCKSRLAEQETGPSERRQMLRFELLQF